MPKDGILGRKGFEMLYENSTGFRLWLLTVGQDVVILTSQNAGGYVLPRQPEIRESHISYWMRDMREAEVQESPPSRHYGTSGDSVISISSPQRDNMGFWGL